MSTQLSTGVVYHIYNRGNNRENIFRDERNYAYFLNLYAKHVAPVVNTYAYCLLKNHFHLMIRVKAAPEGELASQGFSNFFNAYTKGYNKVYGRTGALFQRPFRRIPVTKNSHFLALIVYIHQNPQKHGLIGDFRKWKYSSYQGLVSSSQSTIEREFILKQFGGQEGMEGKHGSLVDVSQLGDLYRYLEYAGKFDGETD